MSSIQSQFDNMAIDLLPRIKAVIAKAPEFESNQMKIRALQAIMDSDKPIALMTQDEKDRFSDSLIKLFIWRKWMSGVSDNG